MIVRISQVVAVLGVCGHFKPVSEEEFLLRCRWQIVDVSIYLVMVDQGSTAPQWLQDFLATSVRALDRTVDGPPVKEIFLLHEFVSGYDVCPEAALDVCRALGIAQSTTDFAAQVREFLERSQKMRFDILEFALTQPYEALDQKLAELHPRAG